MKAVSLNERKVRYMKLAMGCDPAAYRFYQKLLERMRDEGYDIIDIDVSPNRKPMAENMQK